MTGRLHAGDGAALVLLLILGLSLGSFVFTHFTGQPRFYQEEFGPAVMFAAGRGFTNPAVVGGTPLSEFLAVRRPALDVRDVPAPTQPLDQFQQGHRYLMLAVGLVWRMSGIAWASVSRIAALLCALMLGGCYVLLRLWLPVISAALGTAFFAVSPLHLAQLPHVRDYAKGPFIVIAIALTAVSVLWPLTARRRIIVAALCGAVTGFGLGFRTDLTIVVPIFVISVLLFAGRRPWLGLGGKAAAVAAFLAAFVAVGGPVLFRLTSRGSNGYHVILLGISDAFDGPLRVTRPPYSVLPFYNDGLVTAMVKEYGARRTGVAPSMPSADYDAVGRDYWLAVLRHFPADAATRALGAAAVVLNSPFDNPALNFLSGPDSRLNVFADVLTNPPPHRMRIGRLFEILATLNGAGVVFGIALIAVAAARDVRLGLFAAWMIAVLAAYASLQLADRHMFHLEVVPILAVLVVIGALLNVRAAGSHAIRIALVAGAASVGAIIAGAGMLRLYQTAHLHRLFERYVESPRQPLNALFSDTGHGTVEARWQPTDGAAPYYMLELDRVDARMVPVELQYRSVSTSTDFSRVIAMTRSGGISRLFFPVYKTDEDALFEGIQIPATLRRHVRGLYRVTPPDRDAPLFELRLAGEWRARRLYQMLRAEPSAAADHIRVYAAHSAAMSTAAWFARIENHETAPNPSAVAMAYTSAAAVTTNGVMMDGISDTQSSYILEFSPVVVSGPAALLVHGTLETGGAAFGVLENRQWHHQVTVSEPGEFVAIVPIDHAGTFVPVISNATRLDRERNRFELARFGIVSAGN